MRQFREKKKGLRLNKFPYPSRGAGRGGGGKRLNSPKERETEGAFQLFPISSYLGCFFVSRRTATFQRSPGFSLPCPRVLGHATSLSPRLAPFCDCKFLDVGLKGAKTFAVERVSKRRRWFLLPPCCVVERKYFRKSFCSPPVLLDTRTLDDGARSFADTGSRTGSRSRMRQNGFFHSVCNLIAVKIAKPRPNALLRTSVASLRAFFVKRM